MYKRLLLMLLLLTTVAIVGMPGALAVATISGTVFNDVNNNSKMDVGESGLANWTINATAPPPPGSTDAPIFNATTDADGNYTLQFVDDNWPKQSVNFTVTEIHKPGWIQTFPKSPGSFDVGLIKGSNLTGVNFGNRLGSLVDIYLPPGGTPAQWKAGVIKAMDDYFASPSLITKADLLTVMDAYFGA